MRNNDQTNNLIKWGIILGDFVILNVLLTAFTKWHPTVGGWQQGRVEVFWLVCNLTLFVSEWRFYTVIHRRLVSAGDILKRIVGLTAFHVVLSYLLLKIIDYAMPVGKVLFLLDTVLVIVLVLVRYFERSMVNRYRKSGGNYRTVTLVGSDLELVNVYEKLLMDPTRGYRV